MRPCGHTLKILCGLCKIVKQDMLIKRNVRKKDIHKISSDELLRKKKNYFQTIFIGV